MSPASRTARISVVLRWPVSLAVVGWRYLWRTTPLHRTDETGTGADLPAGWENEDSLNGRRQGIADGAGPLLHRRYGVLIRDTAMDPATLIDAIAADLNRASPEMAVFHKTRGEQGTIRAGDELVVRMPGPWDGPVLVQNRDDVSFELVTLNGHLEAGQIEFRASRTDDDLLRFDIESWCRAGDRLSDLLYNRLRLAKEIQLNMWTHFCLRAAALAHGRPTGGVTIVTRRLDWPPPASG